jgi:hypothetical protein
MYTLPSLVMVVCFVLFDVNADGKSPPPCTREEEEVFIKMLRDREVGSNWSWDRVRVLYARACLAP